MIKRLICTIWTPMSSVLKKADKLNLSLSHIVIYWRAHGKKQLYIYNELNIWQRLSYSQPQLHCSCHTKTNMGSSHLACNKISTWEDVPSWGLVETETNFNIGNTWRGIFKLVYVLTFTIICLSAVYDITQYLAGLETQAWYMVICTPITYTKWKQRKNICTMIVP